MHSFVSKVKKSNFPKDEILKQRRVDFETLIGEVALSVKLLHELFKKAYQLLKCNYEMGIMDSSPKFIYLHNL